MLMHAQEADPFEGGTGWRMSSRFRDNLFHIRSISGRDASSNVLPYKKTVILQLTDDFGA